MNAKVYILTYFSFFLFLTTIQIQFGSHMTYLKYHKHKKKKPSTRKKRSSCYRQKGIIGLIKCTENKKSENFKSLKVPCPPPAFGPLVKLVCEISYRSTRTTRTTVFIQNINFEAKQYKICPPMNLP